MSEVRPSFVLRASANWMMPDMSLPSLVRALYSKLSWKRTETQGLSTEGNGRRPRLLTVMAAAFKGEAHLSDLVAVFDAIKAEMTTAERTVRPLPERLIDSTDSSPFSCFIGSAPRSSLWQANKYQCQWLLTCE